MTAVLEGAEMPCRDSEEWPMEDGGYLDPGFRLSCYAWLCAGRGYNGSLFVKSHVRKCGSSGGRWAGLLSGHSGRSWYTHPLGMTCGLCMCYVFIFAVLRMETRTLLMLVT
jgi:hypothetical protein